MLQSLALLFVTLLGLLLPVLAQHRPDDQQKTEKACIAEWRAKKATAPKGMTQNAYVEACRNGAATALTATTPSPPAARLTNGAAPPLQTASRPSARVETRRTPDRHGRSRPPHRLENPASAAATRDGGRKLVTESSGQ
jgi:hypothetical protein